MYEEGEEERGGVIVVDREMTESVEDKEEEDDDKEGGSCIRRVMEALVEGREGEEQEGVESLLEEVFAAVGVRVDWKDGVSRANPSSCGVTSCLPSSNCSRYSSR